MSKAEQVYEKWAMIDFGEYLEKVKDFYKVVPKGEAAGVAIGATVGGVRGATSKDHSVFNGIVGGALVGGTAGHFLPKYFREAKLVNRVSTDAKKVDKATATVKKTKPKISKVFVDQAEVTKGERHAKAIKLNEQRKKIKIIRDAQKKYQLSLGH